MNPKNNFIACAAMAMEGHAISIGHATNARTQERREYWLSQAQDDERRARFYLRRAGEFEALEQHNKEMEAA